MNTFDSNYGTQRSGIYMAVAIVTSTLLLVTSITVSSFGQQPPMIQPGGRNATTTASLAACANQTQTAGSNMTSLGSAATTGGAPMTSGGDLSRSADATSSASQAASEARMHIEEACKALQSNDVKGALMHLSFALISLNRVEANLGSTTTAGNNTNSTG
jgi:hypothetical protein